MQLATDTSPFLKPRRLPTAAGYTRFTFDVRTECAPAFRSAINEISNDLGTRLTGSHTFAKEQALTDAVSAMGALRAEVFAQVPQDDPHYG